MKYILFCKECGESYSINEKNFHAIPEEEPENKKYTQDWPAYNKAKVNEKILFLEIINELLNQIDFKREKSVGRPRANLRDLIFCCAIQSYSGLASRRAIADINIVNSKNYIDKIYHFNTILRGYSNPEITSIVRNLITLSALPLRHIENTHAIDSSGFSTTQFGRWMDYRLEGEKRYRKWKKCHIVCGTKTNIITAVKVTAGTAADCPTLPELVSQTNVNFEVSELSADKGYLSRKNFDFVKEIGGLPFIMFKEDSIQTKKGSSIWRDMYKMMCLEPEKYFKHYHQRSNVETCFFMLKRKFGSSLRSKSSVGHENEILFKVLCHNICCLIQEMYETGICTYIQNPAPKLENYV